MTTQMIHLENQLKEFIKDAVREVIQEEIEKGSFQSPTKCEPKANIPEPTSTESRHPDSIIRPKELCDMLSVSLSTLYEWESKGKMPNKIKLSNHAVGWRYKDITEWLGYD